MGKGRGGSKTYEPSPSRSLDGGGGGVELLLEVFERTKLLGDGVLEGTVFQDAAVAFALFSRGCEVLPKERVVDVAFGRSGSEITALG